MEIREDLGKIEKTISDRKFIEGKGLSNEVGYYIFDYPAKKELEIRKYIEDLKRRNKSGGMGFELKVYDLYDLMIDIIEEEDLLEDCIEMEGDEGGFDYLIEAVNDLMQMHEDRNYFLNYIEENTPENSVIFIIGVGKIFPFMRSHGILNKLHLMFDRAPVVLFYPGKYDEQSLMLFSEFKDGNYYRAFPLIR